MLTSLRLIDFRCFESISLNLDSSTVYFVGENAQGKTSLLEAIAVASRLGSPRASRLSHIVREGRDGCGVALECGESSFKSVYQDRKFQLNIDGVPVKRKDYLMQSPRIVWLESRDLDLIRASGDKRRRFLDAIGSQFSTSYAKALKDYTKALRSRNVLLKEGREREGSFKVFSDLLVESGMILIEYRERIIDQLLPYLVTSHAQISNSRESFALQYQPSVKDFESELQANFTRDCVMRQTMLGPHRDDFLLLVDGRGASDFASEGQQRTLAISLRLAQGELLKSQALHQEVIYLVDDVFGELDNFRRRAFLEALPSDSQKLFTTTSLNWAQVSGSVYTIKGSEITPQ